MNVDIRPDATHWLKVLSGDLVIDVAVHEWAVEQPKTTVFCLHSFTGNGLDFALLATDLKAQGIATFAVDMPGRGNSSFLADPENYTIRLQQLVLYEAIALSTGPLVLIGTSWGGAISGAILPHVRRDIDALILVDAPMISGHDAVYPYQDFLRDEADTTFVSMQSAEIYYTLTRKLKHLPASQLKHLLSAAIMKTGDRYRLRYDPALAQRIGRRMPFDLTLSIAKKPVPVMAVLGVESHLLDDPEQVAARRKVPNLTELICPYEAHPPSLTRPSDIRTIVDFISRHASA